MKKLAHMLLSGVLLLSANISASCKSASQDTNGSGYVDDYSRSHNTENVFVCGFIEGAFHDSSGDDPDNPAIIPDLTNNPVLLGLLTIHVSKPNLEDSQLSKDGVALDPSIRKWQAERSENFHSVQHLMAR